MTEEINEDVLVRWSLVLKKWVPENKPCKEEETAELKAKHERRYPELHKGEG